jgi:glucoamylase
LFKDDGEFYRKSIWLREDGNLDFNDTLDASSAYGAMFLEEDADGRLAKTFAAIEKKLLNTSPSGGIPRYERDDYFLTDKKYLGNPWIICTLWLAQYYIKKGRTVEAKKLIDWSVEHAEHSGMMAEQVNPEDGRPLSVSPLVWSHSTFAETVLMLAGINVYEA